MKGIMKQFQKSIASISLGLALLAGCSTIVFAGTTERVQDRAKLRQENSEARQELRITQTQERVQEREEIREQVQANLQERRADFAEQHADRIERRFNLYTKHLLNIASRIETRAQMMSKNGKNTTEVLAKVTEAKTFITSAQLKGAEAVSKFRSIDPSTYETQREIALTARDLAGAGREDFKSARDLLHEAVRLLANNQQPVEGE